MYEERSMRNWSGNSRNGSGSVVRHGLAYGAGGTALFIDIENVIGHCAALGLPVRLRPICEKMKELAPLRVRRAFGDIAKTMNSTGNATGIVALRKELATNLVEIQDVPYVIMQKNSADIHLVVSALALAYENPFISHFAFVATDRDYVPLYGKLKECGKTVAVMGINESFTSGVVVEAADYLFFYEQLPEVAVFLKTGSAFAEEPDASEATPVREPLVLAAANPAWGADELCAAYKEVLKMVLRSSSFPSLAERKAILDVARDTFAVDMTISEWSNKTAQSFRVREENGSFSSTVSDNMIYKLLLSLYFSRAVRVRDSQDVLANRRILEFACPPAQLNEYLERNYISTIILKTPYDLRPEALAKLLYDEVSAEGAGRCEQYLNELSHLLVRRPSLEEVEG